MMFCICSKVMFSSPILLLLSKSIFLDNLVLMFTCQSKLKTSVACFSVYRLV